MLVPLLFAGWKPHIEGCQECFFDITTAGYEKSANIFINHNPLNINWENQHGS